MATAEKRGRTLFLGRGETLFLIATLLGFIYSASLHMSLADSRDPSLPAFFVVYGFLWEFYHVIVPDALIGAAFHTFILAIFSGILGFVEPRHAWRWGFASAFLGPMLHVMVIICSNLIIERLNQSNIFDLFRAVIWWGMICILPIVVAYLAARIRIRRDGTAGQKQYSPGQYRKTGRY